MASGMDLGSCGICGDRLGVYEPVVVIDKSGPRITAQAAEPDLPLREGACFHKVCFERLPPGSLTA